MKIKSVLKGAAVAVFVTAAAVAVGFCGYVLWIAHGIGTAI